MNKTATKSRSRAAGVPDDYLALIQAFPLRPIRNDRMAARAWEMIERLAPADENKLTPGQADYLYVLSNLVYEYDRRHHPVEPAGLDGIDYLQHLMEQTGMNASDLGRLLGNRTLGATILRRERQLSKTHVMKLAEHFKVEPGLFLRAK